MKSIKQQYIDLQEGKMSQSNFMRNVRMTLPQFITNVTSYDDTVRILKNKGIITEAELNLAGNLKVGDKLKKINTSTPGTVTIKKIDGNKISVEDEAIPGRLFQWYADGIEAEIKAGKLKLQTPTEEGNNSEEDTMSDDEFDALIAQEEDKEDAEKVMGDKSDFTLNEAKTKWENTSGKAMYDQFKEIDNLNGQEVFTGITCEMENNPELTKKEATKIVIKNLKKQPNYYTDYKLSGVEGYEPKIIGNVDPKTRQMKYVTKDNLVDKEMGMKPVKNVAKAKASANKAKKETNKAKDIDVLSLVAQTLRGVPKMQSQGEKMKTIKLRETIQRLVKEVLEEDKTLNEDFKYFKDFAEFEKELFDKWPDAKDKKYKEEDAEGRIMYSDGRVTWGLWDPNRPNTPSGKPPGAVNQNVGMTARDIIYRSGTRMD
jgi:hypothetical protein